MGWDHHFGCRPDQGIYGLVGKFFKNFYMSDEATGDHIDVIACRNLPLHNSGH
jgi:hypothetical protein